MTKYRVSFDFYTSDDKPQSWEWENLILIDDETDKINWESFRLDEVTA
jgi:hypothetical protein